ncbi:helix-turn-helix domain-containing protein [uncultured Roseobacter sp.]|uniref:helix-turn-helix domain-containing protein n=1 Tax=uncultured Roseobacter sp. TaxID=114847 RepID=UPI00261BA5C9|nr:helix-turn-helix domain-containing protein [uncultured Roseobacter sp.]
MSHKATNWLASLDASVMNSGAFRVLFHLCDCHNPSDGCFPSQGYLRKVTGLSNGGLNNALLSLEKCGLISRHRRVDAETRKQRPTRYMMAFEKGFRPKSSIDDEVVKSDEKPSPESGDGSVSNSGGKPSPLSGHSRLHSTGDKPVREPVNNLRAREEDQNSDASVAIFWAKKIKAGKPISSSAISLVVARKMLELGLCEEEELRRIGVAF